jgi:hypothetical protein
MITPLITEIAELLARSGRPFWLAGGYAIDLFLGRRTRAHQDLDFIVRRVDQLVMQDALSDWDLRAVDPPGSGVLRAWQAAYYYELPVHNVWGRRNENAPWELELLFSEFEGDEWVYRRNRDIRGSIESFGWRAENGLMVVAPEIQLLYKSRSLHPKDTHDLESCLSQLSPIQTSSLRSWIARDSGESHPWLARLE